MIQRKTRLEIHITTIKAMEPDLGLLMRPTMFYQQLLRQVIKTIGLYVRMGKLERVIRCGR